MSIEEQDQILGRLTRQCSEAFRTINALGAKIHSFGTDLSDIAKNLNSRDLLGPDGLGPKGTIATAIRVAQEIPDRQIVVNTLEELRAETERYNDLRTQLDRFKTAPNI